LKIDYNSAYPWAKMELLKETSIFTPRLRVRELRESGGLSKKDENLVKVIPCREGEPICNDESSDRFVFSMPHFSPKCYFVFPYQFLKESC